MPVGEPAARCGCGRRGCWEASIGLHAMLAAVDMPELATPLASAEAVADRAGIDEGVRRSDSRGSVAISGVGLAVLVHVLDPAVVVLGGYFAVLGDHVIAPALLALDELLLGPVRGPELRLGWLGIDAAALGAAERAFTEVFSGDRELPV